MAWTAPFLGTPPPRQSEWRLEMKRLPLLLSLEHSPDVIETLKNECNLSTYQVKRAKELLKRGRPPLVRKDILPYMLGISDVLIESMEKFQDRNYRIYRVKKA